MNNVERADNKTMDVRDAHLFAFLMWLGNSEEKDLDFIKLMDYYAIVGEGLKYFVDVLNPSDGRNGLGDKLLAPPGDVRRMRGDL